MPGAGLKRGLQGIVVGCAYAVELQDRAEVREGEYCSGNVVRLVNVRNYIQFPSLVANIANLKHAGFAQAFLHLQTVGGEVWRAKILVDCEQIEPRFARAEGIWANSNSREDRIASRLDGLPVV